MKASTLRRHASIEPKGAGVVLSALHPAYRGARSMFPSRVFDPDEVGRVLKDGHQSRKIGRTVLKGARRGWPIFTLTLEERATCPRTCAVWGACYGNNMQAAERITPGDELEATLWREIAALQAAHPRGFLIRLHVLGDFYSAGYVEMWARAIATFPALHVFGYTARSPFDEIGRAVLELAAADWGRFAVRFSGWRGASRGAVVVDTPADTDHVICPAQTGGTDCCATCALCWHSERTIAFLKH
ncbi:MAG: hypothetical protein KAY22_12485 [Rhizorhabdus sp.]|uniref:GP88 family protein n=1 Tax=Rhizorhabdus sp. TaxID=1968843 RepID=UPI001B4013B4|nr:hypothetical protein [Rhizorhabdus sp.]MBP8233116.1 hypothetical protein [Rhizorhabdus sp.]